jgi:uncharacterized protein (TIGR00730 family)
MSAASFVSERNFGQLRSDTQHAVPSTKHQAQLPEVACNNLRMHVAVFCSAFSPEGTDDAYVRELAQLLGDNGHCLVWGGNRVGLMASISDAVRDCGGKLVGVGLEKYRHSIHPDADEIMVVETLAERKALLLERADAFVVLPGGIGTMDEFFDVLELKKHRLHDKPIVVLDPSGFYDGLKAQLRAMEEAQFLPMPLDDLVTFVTTPADALAAFGTASI